MKKTLFYDNCVFEKCNLQCKYCRDHVISDHNPPESRSMMAKSIAIATNPEYASPAILKLSGYGEITLIKDFISLIPRGMPVQLITNGLLLTKPIVQQIAALGNVHVCISLDGHTRELNQTRTESTSVHGRVLRNLVHLADAKVPTEINSVLTRNNTAKFASFLEFLNGLFPAGLTCYPFPLRQFGDLNIDGLRPSLEDIEAFRCTVVEEYDQYSSVLPPKAYLRRLLQFLKTGRRSWACYVGASNVGVVPSGAIVKCACGVSDELGNVFTNPADAFQARQQSTRELISEPDRLLAPNCAKCFTHYEMVNLFVDNEISLKELQAVRIYGEPSVQRTLLEMKDDFAK